MHTQPHAILTDEVRTAAPLIEAIRSLGCASTLDEVITIVKRAARVATQADGVTFVLRDGTDCHYVDEDAIEPLWKGRRFPMTSCVSGWSMHHRMPAVIPDIVLDPRIPQGLYRATFVRSMVMVPIRSSAPVGAIGAYWATVRGISGETVHWLQALADATSAALDTVLAGREAEQVAVGRTGLATETGGDIVRICAWTRRIQHDGQWLSLEAFLRVKFGIIVSHGISDEAMAALEDELGDTFGPDRALAPM